MSNKYLTKKRIFLFATVLLVFVILNSLLISALQLFQIKKQIAQKISFIQNDVEIKDGKWNLLLYNSDPKLIGTYPLYFFTSEGFVLDRRAPIPGFLDFSDFDKLLLYKKPQTVTTITNQTRRIASLPVMQKDKQVGVIAVSYFEPKEEALPEIDKKLFKNLSYIRSKTKVTKGEISLKNFDERYIDYGISFVIVDNYNNILKKTNNSNSINRIPNVIDPSYIKPFIKKQRMHIVYDNAQKEYFLLLSEPILNKSETPIGVIIVGQSLSPIFSLLPGFIIGQILLLLLFSFGMYILLLRLQETTDDTVINTIIFNEKKGVLIIGKKEVEIPYATNQYYLVQALFTHPKKRFETDELLKRFGEDTQNGNWRKVYDTMIKVNKKVLEVFPKKLILNQNKTYQLNPTIEAIKQST